MISQHELNVLLLEAQNLLEAAMQEFMDELQGEQPVDEDIEEDDYARGE